MRHEDTKAQSPPMAEEKLIKSYSINQDQILEWISRLYISGPFDVDVTYGQGNFYRKIGPPRYKFDINPAAPEVIPADVRHMPLGDECISSAIFDPPFLPRRGLGGLMVGKYGCCESMQAVWELYRHGIKELTRVCTKGAIIVVKCQDCIEGRTQYMTHIEVANYAITSGLYPIDIFILIARSRARSWNHKNQFHSRKYHTYFWVFKKANRNIAYCMSGFRQGRG